MIISLFLLQAQYECTPGLFPIPLTGSQIRTTLKPEQSISDYPGYRPVRWLGAPTTPTSITTTPDGATPRSCRMTCKKPEVLFFQGQSR
jgi:hypothetical protein